MSKPVLEHRMSLPPMEPHAQEMVVVDYSPDLTGINLKSGITMAQKYRTLAGCVIIHLVIGTLYVWGGISPYVASYLKASDPSITLHSITLIFPFMVLIVNTSTTIGVKLCEKFPPMYVIIGCSFIMCCSVLIVSFMKNLAGYIVFYMIIFALTSGIMYLIPLKIAWGYFPEKKGTVSGLILFGYGFGAFIFNFVAKAIVNSENLKPTLLVVEGSENVKYFTKEVYENVPLMFQILFACYSVMIITGVLLIKFPHFEPPVEHPIHHHTHEKHPHKEHNFWSWHVIKHEQEHHHHRFLPECQSIKDGLSTYAFWSMFFLAVTMIFFGQFMINNYKNYGVMYSALENDTYLTTIGSISSFCNGSSRIIWATFFDKYGFRCVFYTAAITQAILSATMSLTTGSKALYGIWLCLSLWCMGCYFSTFPPHTAKIFGNKLGTQFYSFILIGIGGANMIAFSIRQARLDLNSCFWIGFSFTIVGMILVFFQKNTYLWEVEDDEDDIKYLEGDQTTGPREGPRRKSRKSLSKIETKDLEKIQKMQNENTNKETNYHTLNDEK